MPLLLPALWMIAHCSRSRSSSIRGRPFFSPGSLLPSVGGPLLASVEDPTCPTCGCVVHPLCRGPADVGGRAHLLWRQAVAARGAQAGLVRVRAVSGDVADEAGGRPEVGGTSRRRRAPRLMCVPWRRRCPRGRSPPWRVPRRRSVERTATDAGIPPPQVPEPGPGQRIAYRRHVHHRPGRLVRPFGVDARRRGVSSRARRGWPASPRYPLRMAVVVSSFLPCPGANARSRAAETLAAASSPSASRAFFVSTLEFRPTLQKQPYPGPGGGRSRWTDPCDHDADLGDHDGPIRAGQELYAMPDVVSLASHAPYLAAW